MVLLLIAWYTKGDIKRVISTYPNQPETILKYILTIYWEPYVEHKNYENNDLLCNHGSRQRFYPSRIQQRSKDTTIHLPAGHPWTSTRMEIQRCHLLGRNRRTLARGMGKRRCITMPFLFAFPGKYWKWNKKQLEIENQQTKKWNGSQKQWKKKWNESNKNEKMKWKQNESRGGVSQFSPTISRVTSYSFILTR